MVFGHDQSANHPARLAHIKLARPAARILKFVFARAPELHFQPNIFWHARAARQESDKPTRVILMFFPDSLAVFWVGLGIIVICSDVIGGKRAVVVNIRFSSRDPDGIPEIV